MRGLRNAARAIATSGWRTVYESRTAFLAGLAAALVAVSSSPAQQFPIPLRFVTTDGTWDCIDAAGEALGTVVALESAYGVIGNDDKVIGYGKLHRVGEDRFDLPHYLILDGYLKDELGFVGTSMRGPKEDYENYSTGILFALIKPDSTEFECTRRLVQGKLQ